MSTPLRRTAVALAGTTLSLGLLVACGDDDPAPTADDPTSAASDASSATAGPDSTDGPDGTGSASGSATATDPPDPRAIPVYYVGDTPQGDRLFREFTQSSGVEPLVAAAAAVTTGDPVDPDYRSSWPSGRFASVEQTADAIVVEVDDEAWLTRGDLDRGRARLAVQQLVYTLQGAIGQRLPLEVEYDGKPAATLLGVTVGAGLRAAPELDVLALVNVTEPAEGSVVSGTITATGRASSFEATVPWTIENRAGKVVRKGFATAEGYTDKLYPWETEIDVSGLAPGRYTFIARTDDPSDGEGGGPTEDTKRITIE
ncbi:MAG TPA: Gmad2 immunoglobulin-like domain-containing protein [Nocardioides sp.]|nr:Gmad2 immunoglobulin-like domain-containing protein [Nocardioides sp.]